MPQHPLFRSRVAETRRARKKKSRTFSFEIANHRGKPSVLSEARLEERRPSDPASTLALRQFLANIRNAQFRGAECVSDREIGIAVAGLLVSPVEGQRDDVIRWFRIRFKPS